MQRSGQSVARMALGVYQDASGRWREANGRFVSSARQAELGLDNAAKSGHRFSRSLGLSSVAMGAAGVAAKGTAIGIGLIGVGIVSAIKKAADFEAQLSSLGAVSNANAKQMAAFRAQALKACADTKYSALEAAKAQTELAKGGLSVAQIMKGGLSAALGLAAAGELDLALAAETTVQAMKQFGIDGNNATHVADALATAANKTTADVHHFAMALTQGGGAAKAAGLSFDETVAALELLADSSVRGSDAGTSPKAALTQIASPTKESAARMKELNLSFFDANGKMRPLASIAGDLRDRFKGMSEQQRLSTASTIAGTDGMRTLLALAKSGKGGIEDYTDGLKEQGTAADLAAKKQDNLKGRIEQLQGSLETAAIIIGTEMLPAVSEFAEGLTTKINEMAESGQLKSIGEDLAEGLDVAADAMIALAEAAPGVISGVRRCAAGLRGLRGPPHARWYPHDVDRRCHRRRQGDQHDPRPGTIDASGRCRTSTTR